ncbi:hypothetical protein BKP56_12790 [Marinilactibacillus sp. 15R]|uniref:DUF6414 family protein n=1 Tax=Marinilactibacillus sp. 15R TaxID=1911586 RepID=UPI00090B939F|nr:hypothetical protein [Marinilactibacillus sp. 15R]API90078.1 hypothetical protein BKP56_12790 [Marinilactibacillus sp. 15R]
MSEKNIYRDIIYFDTDKVQSILSQLNKGLLTSMVESNESEHTGEGSLKTGKILELLLQLPVAAEGSYKYTRNKGLQEEKALHDFALTELLDSLSLNDVSSLERKAFKTGKERLFVKVRGSFALYDYEDLARTIERFNIISSLFNDETVSDEAMIKFSDFIKTAYEGLTALEITNKKGIKFLGAINTSYLRETMRNLLFKYGGNPKGDWEMICQITNIPKNNGETLENSFENFGKDINSTNLSKAKSMNAFMNDIVTEFSKVNDMFSSVSYPNISVEPIAVYKKMDL